MSSLEKVNLSGFCLVQKEVWTNYVTKVRDLPCKKCSAKSLKMVSKWRCICIECDTKHTIKKPKGFPKNMDDKRNWKATCDECGGTMDYYENSHSMAYICNRCNNILEV